MEQRAIRKHEGAGLGMRALAEWQGRGRRYVLVNKSTAAGLDGRSFLEVVEFPLHAESQGTTRCDGTSWHDASYATERI
jgi:hypothetical protein